MAVWPVSARAASGRAAIMSAVAMAAMMRAPAMSRRRNRSSKSTVVSGKRAAKAMQRELR